MRDLMNNLDVKRALSPVAAAPTDNTAMVTQILDLAGCQGAVLVIAAGTLADADATFAVTLEEGDAANLSDTGAVAAADLIGTLALASFTFAGDDKVFKLGYKGGKRYIRATITPSNNTGNAPLAAIWIRGLLASSPAANPPA